MEILHIINHDKFSTQYINFMKMELNQYSHYFILLKSDFSLQVVNTENIYQINSYVQLLFDRKCKFYIKSCDKIVITGVFGSEQYLLPYPKEIWNKIFLHFWGGDFYKFRECNTIAKRIKKQIMLFCIKRSRKVVNLIEEDFFEFYKLFPINIEHFVAAMPANPADEINFESLRKRVKTDSKLRILIGNSATEENQHIDAFNLIKHFKDENILVFCPLSYGDNTYRSIVINEGENLFKEKFIPLTKFLTGKEYIDFLSTCDVGVFNNNRQQALGNIQLLTRLGKKVYIRDDTPMWNHFKKRGYILENVDHIYNMAFDKFSYYDDNSKINNCDADDSFNFQKRKIEWISVFEKDLDKR